MSGTVAQWDVWWADFDPQVGREQAGQRPAIVVGTALACRLPNDLVFVVPCTTKDRGLATQPGVPSLGKASVAMCDQIKSINRQRLVRRHKAKLAEAEIDAIRFILRQMIDVRSA